MQAIGGGLGGEHSDEIAMALFEGDLVDAEHGGWFERRPIDRGGNPAVEDTEQGIVADIFFRDDIGHGAVDQLNDQEALVGLGMQGALVVPIEFLGGGRVVIAVGTAKAFGTNAQIDGSTQDRKMAQQARAILAVLLGDGSTTAATARATERTLDREDELIGLRQVRLEHADIGNIERDRDEWLLGHGSPPSVHQPRVGDCAPILPRSQPLDVGACTGSPKEPINNHDIFIRTFLKSWLT